MGTGVELDFAMDCAKSTRAKARSRVEVVPGGAMVEGSGFQTGSPVRVVCHQLYLLAGGPGWAQDLDCGVG